VLIDRVLVLRPFFAVLPPSLVARGKLRPQARRNLAQHKIGAAANQEFSNSFKPIPTTKWHTLHMVATDGPRELTGGEIGVAGLVPATPICF
jgi:hypothetical protein